ncbi:G-protein coupled receptor dmsr-1-like [Dreissena polymorpha]|nr:G-protein coupled receptor dmsr-1-like [Dreissena polymorpha]
MNTTQITNISVPSFHVSNIHAQRNVLDTYSRSYSTLHGYASLVICAIGIPLNSINIIVLTRKKMQTPINCILTWLAVFDMTTMISYIPFAIHFYCQYPATKISPSKNSWGWMNFLLVYLNVSATAHTISIWLAVALAIFRHHHIHSPAKGNLTRIRRLIRARLVVCIIVISSAIAMIPNYMSHTLEEAHSGAYVFEPLDLGSGKEKPIILVGLILYSCLAKILPCCLIIVYGSLLLITLHASRLAHSRTSNDSTVSGQLSTRTIRTSRTTIMLLIVIVLFLITELPQGVLILFCIFKEHFFEQIYIPLGDTMDIIALVNSGINFVLYCTMSQEFRKTFIRLFCRLNLNRGAQRSYISTRNEQCHV